MTSTQMEGGSREKGELGEAKEIEPAVLPMVIWNSEDVRNIVNRVGREKAIKIIAGEILQESYVRKMVNIMLFGDRYENENSR